MGEREGGKTLLLVDRARQIGKQRGKERLAIRQSKQQKQEQNNKPEKRITQSFHGGRLRKQIAEMERTAGLALLIRHRQDVAPTGDKHR